MKDRALHILDVAYNSVEAGATNIIVKVWDNAESDKTGFSIEDNGKGIPEEIIHKITDPFFTTRKTRKVGLGLALLKQSTEQTGGSLVITSKVGIGTKMIAEFVKSHPDTPPEGDMAGVWTQFITAVPDVNFEFRMCTVPGGNYAVSTKEVQEALGEIPVGSLKVKKMIHELISENLNELKK